MRGLSPVPKAPWRALRALLTALVLVASAARGRADVPAKNVRPMVPFVPNEGQLDARIAFRADTRSGRVFVLRDGRVVHSGAGWSLTETLLGDVLSPAGAQAAVTRVSSYIGSDPACWRAGLPTYESVDLGRPWPGIGVSLRLTDGRAEKLFRLDPAASEKGIRVRVEGAKRLRRANDGALLAATRRGDVTLSAPIAYQPLGDRRIPVAVSYRVLGDRYGFRLGPHDASLPVVIDPVVDATYIGGSDSDNANSVAVDASTGDVYVVGTTTSTDLPFITDAAQSTPNSSYVARFQGDLTVLYQTTYLGGSSGDVARAVQINPTNGEVIVAGWTLSSDFPGASTGAQNSIGGGWDAFVARLEPNLLGLDRATYYGGTGNEQFYLGLAVHPTSGRIYLTGETSSTSLPFTTGGAQTSTSGGTHGYVVAFDATLATAVQGTFYAGNGNDYPYTMTLDVAHDGVLIGGFTNSSSLPNTFGAGQPSYSAGLDGFVALFDLDLTMIDRSTYIGGAGTDSVLALGIHPTSGNLYVTGYTDSTDLKGTAGGAQPSRNPISEDMYVASFEPALTVFQQATYLGGSAFDRAYAIAFAASGDVILVGSTQSDDFPGTAGAARPRHKAKFDAVAARLNAGLTTLLQSTYYGGLGDDIMSAAVIHPTSGNLLIAGTTNSADLPGKENGGRGFLNGSQDGFVAQITTDLTSAAAPTSAVPIAFAVDPAATFYSNGNGVFEPGEMAAVRTTWKNFTHTAVVPTGQMDSLTGPPAGNYFLTDDAGSYGTLNPGAAAECTAGFDCYAISITAPSGRPATHWDATLHETLSTTDAKGWLVHLGNSFTDVLPTQPFYARIETLLHNGVTGGCTPTTYCPSQAVTRDQMAIFLAKVVAEGAAKIPLTGTINGSAYNCFSGGASLFIDVQPTDPFCKHVHYLAYWGITKGCTATAFCPTSPVDRASMAAFLVRGLLAGPAPAARNADPVTGRFYNCSAGSPNVFFTDVLPTDPFCGAIHYLWARGMVSGCGADTYCPSQLVTRDAMAKFLVNTYGLKLYGP